MSIATSVARSVAAAAAKCAAALLPQNCLLCAAPAGNDAVCDGCAASLPRLTDERCPVCALPTPGAATCGRCLKRAPSFDATRAVFRYEHPIDHLIQALKYAHRLASADFLGRSLAATPVAAPPDLILPVPLAAQRLAERGFNQALEIARPLAQRLGAPLETGAVRRRRDTPPQATLPWKERVQNIRHAFECDADLGGLRIIVVDDVMTTGATLDELARTLKAHGAARVENHVVARALRD